MSGISLEDAARFTAGRNWESKVLSAARGEGVTPAAMREMASRYMPAADGGVRLPIADQDKPVGFRVDEALSPVVFDAAGGKYQRRGQVVAGSKVFQSTGDPECDAVLSTFANASVKPPQTHGALQAAQAAGYTQANQPPAAPRAKQAAAPAPKPVQTSVQTPVQPPPEPAPSAPPDQGVIAIFGPEGGAPVHKLRCRRAFLEPARRWGRNGHDVSPALLTLALAESPARIELPLGAALTMHLAPLTEREPATLSVLWGGVDFVDRSAGTRYVCFLVNREEEDDQDGTDGGTGAAGAAPGYFGGADEAEWMS